MRIRDIARIDGFPCGEYNAVTDVKGVRVGHSTVIKDGAGPVEGIARTGVTVVLPAGDIVENAMYAGVFSLNGNGELSGCHWIEESGLLTTPIALTNTHSLGIVRDAMIDYYARLRKTDGSSYWMLPVVGETWDGWLSDINGMHVRPEHLCAALDSAASGPVEEGCVGGGTGMIGDPSGRTDMRQMLTPETIQHNCDCFKKQMSRFIDFSDDKALLVNNAEWLMNLNYVNLLREVGPHFSVNRMLTAECYKQRMERGLSFLEFNYMIMQSYDFYALFQKYGCNMQFGGDDQWSNMLGGTELIRRKLGKDAYAMTINLLLNSEGKKMGKTQSGAVWLDPNKTSPFDFYQYWRNVGDGDVLKCLRMLTFLPLEQIEEMDAWEGSKLNEAKEILAFELTKLVHGEEEAVKAQEGARALFSSGNAAQMPETKLVDEDFEDGKIGILKLMVKAGLATSNGEARRNVEQGGVSVDGNQVKDIKAVFTKDQLAGEGMVVKRGKKNFKKVVLK